jgi:hypothetical protein
MFVLVYPNLQMGGRGNPEFDNATLIEAERISEID